MQLEELVFFIAAIAAGYFAARFRFVSEDTENILPQVLIHVCYPAMILTSFSQIDLHTLLATGATVLIATLAITLALYLLSGVLFRKAPADRRPLQRFQAGIGNVAYVAIPLLSVFLNPSAIPIAMIHGSAQDLLIWSLYYPLFVGAGRSSAKDVLKKLFTAPCIIALLLGILLKVLNVSIPELLLPTIEKIGAAAAPLALIYLGLMIHRFGLFRWVRNAAAIRYSVYKVLLLPLAVALLLLPFCDRQTAILLAILFGSPAPIMSIIWSGNYGGDVPYAIDCCIGSTLLYLVLMSLACFLLTGFGVVS